MRMRDDHHAIDGQHDGPNLHAGAREPVALDTLEDGAAEPYRTVSQGDPCRQPHFPHTHRLRHGSGIARRSGMWRWRRAWVRRFFQRQGVCAARTQSFMSGTKLR